MSGGMARFGISIYKYDKNYRSIGIAISKAYYEFYLYVRLLTFEVIIGWFEKC